MGKDPGLEPPPGPFDRRFRLACDLYNRGLAMGVTTGAGSNAVVQLASGPRSLAPGTIELELLRPNFK